MSGERRRYERNGLDVQPQDEWQMWEGTIYRYEYLDKRFEKTKNRTVQIYVPVQIADFLRLKHREKIMIAIKRKEDS